MRNKSWIVMGYIDGSQVIFVQVSAGNAEGAEVVAREEFAKDGYTTVDVVFVGLGRIGENEYVANSNLEQVGLRNAVAGEPQLARRV